MGSRFEIEQKLGTPLGERGSDRKSVAQAFRKKGLAGLNPTSISRLKAGMISGERTNWRLDASRVLEEDNAGLKNLFYEQIAQVGVSERRFNTSPQRAHMLKSDHFVEDVARALEQDPQVVRRSIRGMRVDMVLAQASSPNTTLLRQFFEIAERLIDHNYRLPPSMRSPSVNILDQVWDHATSEIVGSTGIEIDEGVIEQHRNILVYGRPAYHSSSRQ
ncbi:MAG: hypothetical protein HYU80_03435 [Candidatus Blackburnbacteria bacterium]|nr:hypothetical protein [Candidatus Blackburnbacteria bacterium]